MSPVCTACGLTAVGAVGHDMEAATAPPHLLECLQHDPTSARARRPLLRRHKVLLLVSDVAVPTETGAAEGGFYVTVVVPAAGTDDAIGEAIKLLRSSEKYQSVVGARSPAIVPSEVGLAPATLRDGLATGFVFFLNEGGSSLA